MVSPTAVTVTALVSLKTRWPLPHHGFRRPEAGRSLSSHWLSSPVLPVTHAAAQPLKCSRCKYTGGFNVEHWRPAGLAHAKDTGSNGNARLSNMAQCSSPADLSEASKRKKVAIITGITGQVTTPTSGFLVTMLLLGLSPPPSPLPPSSPLWVSWCHQWRPGILCR